MPPKRERFINYRIRQFDMKNIQRDKIVALIGRRGAGKSTIIEDICYNVRSIPMATVICRTRGGRKTYSKFIPESYIYEKYSEDVVSRILKRQDDALQAYEDGRLNNPYALLVMDDCLHDAKIWTKDENIQHIFFNGRHDKLMFVFAMQYSLGIPPELRNQIDYVFLLKENKINNRKRLFEHYAGMFPSYETFSRVFDEFTNNYECLVIDNTVLSNNIEDMVFFYRARLHDPFTVGCKSYWKHHAVRHNPEHRREQLEKEKQIEKLKRQYGYAKSTILIERQEEPD